MTHPHHTQTQTLFIFYPWAWYQTHSPKEVKIRHMPHPDFYNGAWHGVSIVTAGNFLAVQKYEQNNV